MPVQGSHFQPARAPRFGDHRYPAEGEKAAENVETVRGGQHVEERGVRIVREIDALGQELAPGGHLAGDEKHAHRLGKSQPEALFPAAPVELEREAADDRKSTRLNSSHLGISYA